MHPLRLLLGKLVHRRVERRNSLTFDEERRPEHLVLDRLLIDLYVNRQPRQAVEKRLPVAQSPLLDLRGDALTELEPERIGRGFGRVARPFAQPRDPRVAANDLGENRFFEVIGLDAQLDASFEAAQQPDKLVVPRAQEVLDESLGAFEDDTEPEREHRPVLERPAEDFGVAEQVTPLRADLRGLDRAGQTRELAVGDRLDRRSMNARALLRPGRVRPRDPVEVESSRGRRVSATGDGTLDAHGSTALRALLLVLAVLGEGFLRSLDHALRFAVAVTPAVPELRQARRLRLREVEPVDLLREPQVGVNARDHDARVDRDQLDSDHGDPHIGIDDEALVQDQLDDVGEPARARRTLQVVARGYLR